MAVIIQIRGGTSASATAGNIILAERELGFETDTRKGKIGDGVTPWNSLPYSFTEHQEPAASETIITSAAAKTTMVDNDLMLLSDSQQSTLLKKITWANLKATLKTYLDGLYTPVGRTLTINGSTQTLAANRTWTITTGADPTRQVVNSSSRIDNLILNASTTIVVITGTGGSITGMDAGGKIRKVTILNLSGDFFNVTANGTASDANKRFSNSIAYNTSSATEWIYDPETSLWYKIG